MGLISKLNLSICSKRKVMYGGTGKYHEVIYK